MDVANLNPMVAPIQAVEAVQPVQSGGGGTFIYVIVVIVLLVSLIAAGYLFYTSQSPRVVDQFPPGYVGPKPDPTPTPTPDTAPMDVRPRHRWSLYQETPRAERLHLLIHVHASVR